MTLERLDDSTATDLVRAVAQGQVSDEHVRRIVARCEGVPLVLEEVTRSALETASRVEDMTARSTHMGEIPTPLELVVQSRLSRWPALTSAVQAASVLGREFSVRLLDDLLSPDRSTDLIEAIKLLAREGLFEGPVSSVDERVRFKHVMIGEAVYNTLLGVDRQRLHSRAADALAERYKGTPDAAPDVLAEHLRKASRFVEAIRTRLAASADTAARGAYVETEGHCEAALKLVDRVADDAERRMLQFRLLVQLGVALTGEHGYSSAKVEYAYRRAQSVCGDSAEAEMLYPIMRGLTAFNIVRGNLAAGYELSLQSLDVAERSQRPEFLIDALSVHCYAVFYYRSLEECRSWIKRCLALYREHGGEHLTYPNPQDAATSALALLPSVEWLLGDPEAAEAAVREGLAHVEQLGKDFDRAMLHSWIAGARYTQRRYLAAAQHAAIAVEISQRNGYREWHGVGGLLALMSQAALQPAPEALQQAAQICTAFAQEGVGLNASYYLWGLARGHARMGDPATAGYLLSEAFKRAEASQETRMNSELLILQAEIEPDDAKAARLLRDALSLANAQGTVATALRAAAALNVRSGGSAPDVELARATLDVLEGRAECPAQAGWMRERLVALTRMRDAATA